jgi:hypothetical protein
MEYNPQMAYELKFNAQETLAYQLSSYYIKTRQKYFPNYRHGRSITDVSKLKKSIIFKHMIKFIKDNAHRFDSFQSMLFIRAQFEIMKKIQDDGKQPLIEINMLHGEQANKRWELWKKWVKEKTNITSINYSFVESNLVYEFEKTKTTIFNLLKDDITIENYINNGSSILRYVLLKKISPLYIICSNWVKSLPEQLSKDVYDLCNIENYKEFDFDKVKNMYFRYFEHEINK